MTPMLNHPDRPRDESIGEKAYRQIRSDIIFGRLQPGQKLRLDDLRQTYSTSISTLRELLNRLASEGFITAEGHRGFEVTRSRSRPCAKSRPCGCYSNATR
jgi:DNA-binding GntR family transcriptional regulator